jgi:hypothetical protein
MNSINELKTKRAEPLADEVLAKLWRLMADVFGYRWVSAFGECDESGTWAKGLAGLTGDDLARGIRRVIDAGMSWPPSLPEFRVLCTPTAAELGLPELDAAYRAACNQNWALHPAVFWAAREVGTWALRNEAEVVTRPRFTKAWDKAIDFAKAGGVFDVPVFEAKAITFSKASRLATGRAHMANIRALLRGNQLSS